MPILTAEGLYKRYGGVTAVAGVSLSLARGEIAGMIGSNGAGKTTLFQMLTSFERPDAGRIYLYPQTKAGESAQGRFDAVAVHGTQAHILARMGVARTFQNLRLFERLTVRENIQAAVLSLRIRGFALEQLLAMLGLAECADTNVEALPYGTRKLCELGRAVAVASAGCGMLFLDEPCAGLCVEETERLAGLLRQLKQNYALTIFIIEHHMAFVEQLCDRLYAMDTGHVIAQGRPQEVLSNAAVRQAVLGE